MSRWIGMHGLMAATIVVATPLSAQQLPPGVVERELTVPGPVPLPGTLTIPAGEGPFRVVVLVHGSGAADRDLSLGTGDTQMKPYRDIAWGLAAEGVATFRYDKRPKVNPFWFVGRVFTVWDETVDDAVSALALVRTQPEIDPKRVFLAGHSLGGMVAPRIAAKDPTLAGIIVMAGATREKLQDAMVRQYAYIESLGGPDSAAVALQRASLAPYIAAIRAVTPADSAKTTSLLGAPAAYYLDMNAYDPAIAMRAVPQPILVLQGMRDYQVTPELMEDWLTTLGPRKDLVVRRLEGVNHLFTLGSGPPSPADYAKGGHVAEGVIKEIAAWTAGKR